jgi:hypothetical protein
VPHTHVRNVSVRLDLVSRDMLAHILLAHRLENVETRCCDVTCGIRLLSLTMLHYVIASL